MWIKIALIMWVVNSSVPTTNEQVVFASVLKKYCSYVGIDLQIARRPLNDRYCERWSLWEDRYNQYNCYKRYVREKKGQWNMFVRNPYITDGNRLGGGLGAICIKNHSKGLSLVAYRSEQPLPSAITGVHETFHNAGADHQTVDPNEIMYPYFNSVSINSNGGMTIGEGTKQSIRECLK